MFPYSNEIERLIQNKASSSELISAHPFSRLGTLMGKLGLDLKGARNFFFTRLD